MPLTKTSSSQVGDTSTQPPVASAGGDGAGVSPSSTHPGGGVGSGGGSPVGVQPIGKFAITRSSPTEMNLAEPPAVPVSRMPVVEMGSNVKTKVS